ncbi:hypothetical protein P885DRAFT_63154 [Corynascus similis CBS 632.67]
MHILKVPFVLTLPLFITAVWAGGYQNCLERVWLYQAYLIDQYNPEAQRQIGYRCSNWRHDSCICDWVPCRGREGRAQCNFDDFQVFLGNLRPGMHGHPQTVNKTDGSLDVVETVKRCLWTWRDHNAAPYNFRGYKAVKHGINDHNDFIYRIGQITNDNYNNPDIRESVGIQAFRNVDDTLSKITTARVADHGRYLIPAARNALPGIIIVEKDSGANSYYRDGWVPPASVEPDPPRWKTVDWENTINNPYNPLDTRTRIGNWLYSYYRGPHPNRRAKDHWQVLRSYKNLHDRTNRCRRH